MNKDTHDIPIKLELPRYEVVTIMYALRELGNRRLQAKDADAIYALADRIFKTTREQLVTFESQNEDKST